MAIIKRSTIPLEVVNDKEVPGWLLDSEQKKDSDSEVDEKESKELEDK